VFGGFELEWFVNVGLPSVPWDNIGLRELYQGIALAGWRLGSASGPVTVSRATSFLAEVQANVPAHLGQLRRERIEAFPEFVAQINSYRRSPQHRSDLHLLIDVGAGTVDIVTFHVWEPEETDSYAILEASVDRRGTHILLGYRAQASGLYLPNWDEKTTRLQTSKFESTFALKAGSLQPLRQFFVDQLHRSLQKVLGETRTHRYETSPNWNEGVPFFLCGGGRNIDVYRDAITRAQTNWKLEEMDLPMPNGLANRTLSREDFHRVSVAHGLSYSADNLGKIDRKSEVPDLRRHRSAGVDYTSRYIEK
jgi:hypothetical protein